MTDQEYPNFRRISDQATLLANIKYISQKHSEFIKEKQNIVKLSTIPEISLNSIYNFKDFIISTSKLNVADLSFLIPFIKIFKIYPNKNSELIPFNNFYPKSSIDAMTSNLSDRGYQANLVSVEFVSQGKDYATTFLHSVKLKIIFDSISTIFNEKSVYLSLFNPPKKTGNIDPDYYQIMLQFGWNTDFSNQSKNSNINLVELQKFANLSNSSIFLHYIAHKINVNEDGSVLLEIEYNGAFENIARNGNEINVLASKKIKNMQKLEKEISSLEQEISDNGDKIETEKDKDIIKTIKIMSKDNVDVTNRYQKIVEQLKSKYNQRTNENQTGKEEFLNSLINNISQQYGERMPALSINKANYEKASKIIENTNKVEAGNTVEEIDRILKGTNDKSTEHNQPLITFETPEYFNANPEAGTDIGYFKDLTLQSVSLKGENSSIPRYNIKYFSFGTLINAIESLKENNFIIAASNCTMYYFGNDSVVDVNLLSKDPKYTLLIDNKLNLNNQSYVLKKESIDINIFDIPIALSTFKHWFLNNIISQNLTSMTLNRFLELCINDLLILATRPDNQDYIPKQNMRFKFILDKINSNKNYINMVEGLKNNTLNFADLSIKSSNKDITTNNYNVLVFYSFPNYINRKSDFKNDTNSGIPHFFYGNYKGIIKKMTFREEAIPHFKEANIQSQVDRSPTWRPGVFLRGKYNVLIEMLGTVNYKIGTLIYISPTFTGVTDPSTVIKYGIGGYFLITSIKHQIESGKFETIIEANWVATGDGVYTDINSAPFQIVKKAKSIQETQAQTEDPRKQGLQRDSGHY